jgi:acetoacetate decarboxylase
MKQPINVTEVYTMFGLVQVVAVPGFGVATNKGQNVDLSRYGATFDSRNIRWGGDHEEN